MIVDPKLEAFLAEAPLFLQPWWLEAVAPFICFQRVTIPDPSPPRPAAGAGRTTPARAGRRPGGGQILRIARFSAPPRRGPWCSSRDKDAFPAAAASRGSGHRRTTANSPTAGDRRPAAADFHRRLHFASPTGKLPELAAHKNFRAKERLATCNGCEVLSSPQSLGAQLGWLWPIPSPTATECRGYRAFPWICLFQSS